MQIFSKIEFLTICFDLGMTGDEVKLFGYGMEHSVFNLLILWICMEKNNCAMFEQKKVFYFHVKQACEFC